MTDTTSNPIHTVSTTHIVYTVLRFLRVVRHRRTIVFASLVVAGLLGAIYYAVAERVYRAEAELLVMSKAPDTWNESHAKEGDRQGMLPTYERLFSSAKIINRTIAELEELPQEARIDLLEYPRKKWVEEIKKRLSASAVRSTKNIVIGFESKRPRTAETVVNTLVKSYKKFIEEEHQSVASEIAELLRVDMAKLEVRLQQKAAQLLAARQASRDIGIDKTDVVHPVIERFQRTGKELGEVTQRRIHLESSLVALRHAIDAGGNLQQHILSLEPTVGKEVVLSTMGLSTADGEVRASLESMLMEKQAKLSQLSAHFLENHPDIQNLSATIVELQQKIAGFGRGANEETEEYNKQLGQMLASLLTEDLRQTSYREQALMNQFAIAESDAMQLNNQFETVRYLEREEQRQRDLFASLQTRLDNINIKTSQSDVQVAVVSEAFAEDRPVSPRLLWVAFVCLSGGTGVGIAIIYVIDVLDDRFRSPEELRDQLGAPVLAIIRQLPEAADTGADALHVHTAPDSIESEAFRTLRTTIAFSGDDLDCLAVSSSEPSDGKTTVLSNLGVAASQAGNRTLLIDADMRRPGLSKLFDVRSENGLGNLLRGQRRRSRDGQRPGS